jgi:hypothetical protein
MIWFWSDVFLDAMSIWFLVGRRQLTGMCNSVKYHKRIEFGTFLFARNQKCNNTLATTIDSMCLAVTSSRNSWNIVMFRHHTEF